LILSRKGAKVAKGYNGKMNSLVPIERIESKILLIRGQKVMLDRDLAGLYGVETRALIQAVKRNIERFPEDFMFQLSKEEFKMGWNEKLSYCLYRTRYFNAFICP